MANNNNQESTKNKNIPLFSVDEKKYGDNFKDHLLEQYKLCVDMTDKVSERRSNSNTFYLTLISALVAIIGILSQVTKPIETIFFWWVVLVSFVGVLFCIIWKANINCYKQLNEAKFKVINEIESKLPVVAFLKEWEYLNLELGKKPKYRQLTFVEGWIPWIFGITFFILLLICLILANFTYLSSLKIPF